MEFITNTPGKNRDPKSSAEIKRLMPRGVKQALIDRTDHPDGWPAPIVEWLASRGCLTRADRGAQWRWTSKGKTIRRDLLRQLGISS